MKRKDKKPSRRIRIARVGKARAIPPREFQLKSDDHHLSDVERDIIQPGSGAAMVGSFAPEEEMDQFYRLHRGV
jgi:hypothetical protein